MKHGFVVGGLLFPSEEEASEYDAVRVLEDIDEARRRWGFHLFGIDTNDASLYDFVIHIDRLSTDDAVDMICRATGLDRFQATAESQQAMDDLLLAARVKGGLIESHPRVNVAAKEGAVYIAVEGGRSSDENAIRDTVRQIPGVTKVDINLFPFTIPD